jgi:hypothetical protein
MNKNGCMMVGERMELIRVGQSLQLATKSAASYSCWSVFANPYNLPLALCMKYEHMFLCLIIPSPDNPGPQLNVMMQPFIEELK